MNYFSYSLRVRKNEIDGTPPIHVVNWLHIKDDLCPLGIDGHAEFVEAWDHEESMVALSTTYSDYLWLLYVYSHEEDDRCLEYWLNGKTQTVLPETIFPKQSPLLWRDPTEDNDGQAI